MLTNELKTLTEVVAGIVTEKSDKEVKTKPRGVEHW